MKISVKVPLTTQQLDAAARIHERLRWWKSTDAMLVDLAKRMPEFDECACLVKGSIINQTYGTNVYRLPEMAPHLAAVMRDPDRDDLVEALAAHEADGKTIRHVSFASKFAHFFVDRERYPIFDKYAQERLRYHLVGAPAANPPPFADYAEAHSALISLCGLGCSGRELDRYLWIGGLYFQWSKKANRKINIEVRNLFKRREDDVELAADLRRLQVV